MRYRIPNTEYRIPRSGESGFTLLLAALVSSIVLALGAAIYGLAVKELQLSSLGRDSQYAFFAADTGAECALYWDIRYDYFATSSPVGVSPKCDEEDIVATGRSATYPYTMSFQFQPGSYCTLVTVTKSQDAVSGIVSTVIHADGYSVNCAGYASNTRALQRSVELHY